MIDTKGLTTAAVLAALYNRARQQGLGVLRQRGQRGMGEQEAQAVLNERAKAMGQLQAPYALYFDYLHGRVLKVDLGDGDGFEERLYDRDNGEGAAAEAIAGLRKRR